MSDKYTGVSHFLLTYFLNLDDALILHRAHGAKFSSMITVTII